MFDFSKILQGLKESIQIVDGPDELSLDMLVKDLGALGLPDGASMGIPDDLLDKASIKQMLNTAGLGDINFEIEKIEGGLRYRCSSQEAKQKIKDLMTQLFQGDMLQKLFEGLFGAFANLGANLGEEGGLGELARKFQDDNGDNKE